MSEWTIGKFMYQDCDSCGLVYRQDSHMFDEHKSGVCVKFYGTKDDKRFDGKGSAFEYGKKQEAAARSTDGQQVGGIGSDSDAASGRIVAAPVYVAPERRVEKGFA